jgi:hypothetical protein
MVETAPKRNAMRLARPSVGDLSDRGFQNAPQLGTTLLKSIEQNMKLKYLVIGVVGLHRSRSHSIRNSQGQ